MIIKRGHCDLTEALGVHTTFFISCTQEAPNFSKTVDSRRIHSSVWKFHVLDDWISDKHTLFFIDFHCDLIFTVFILAQSESERLE